jgi:hypothetical protein
MNPSLSFLERAKQCDLEAIAILLQDLCKPYGVPVKVALNWVCLQVLLENTTALQSNVPTQPCPHSGHSGAVSQS